MSPPADLPFALPDDAGFDCLVVDQGPPVSDFEVGPKEILCPNCHLIHPVGRCDW